MSPEPNDARRSGSSYVPFPMTIQLESWEFFDFVVSHAKKVRVARIQLTGKTPKVGRRPDTIIDSTIKGTVELLV